MRVPMTRMVNRIGSKIESRRLECVIPCEGLSIGIDEVGNVVEVITPLSDDVKVDVLVAEFKTVVLPLECELDVDVEGELWDAVDTDVADIEVVRLSTVVRGVVVVINGIAVFPSLLVVSEAIEAGDVNPPYIQS
jgi:hypothetical protein